MRKDKMLATNTIKINSVRDEQQASVNDLLVEISAGTVEEKWNTFKSIVYKISKEKLSAAVRKHEY